MAAKNEYLPFATGVGANTLSAADYAVAGYRRQGFQDGIVEAHDHNTLFRQFSAISSMIGQFTADNAETDVLDNGDVEALQVLFSAALKGSLRADLLQYVADSSTAANAIIVAPSPAPSAHTPGASYLVRVGRTNTGPVAMAVGALDAKAVVRVSGDVLSAGDLRQGGLYVISFDGSRFQLVGGGGASAGQNAYWHYAADTGARNALEAAPNPAVSAYSAGLPVAVRVASTNNGDATLNVSGLGAVSIVRAGGGAIQAGDLIVGSIALFVHDGTRFQLLNWFSAAAEYSLLHRGDDLGAINALVTTVSPPISAYAKGITALVAVAHSNTGSATINMNDLGVRTIVRSNGTQLQAGDLTAGCFALLAYDGTNFELLNYPPGSGSGGGGGGNGPNTVNIAALMAPYFLTVLSATTTSPPINPSTGDAYLVPAGADGVWSSQVHQIAQWDPANGWIYRAVSRGFLLTVRPSDGALADILERTDMGWRSKFATNAEADAGTSTTGLINPAQLQRRLNGISGAAIYVNVNTTLRAGFYLVDTSDGPITLTLPTNPARGVTITLVDALATWAMNSPILARNGQTIMGQTGDLGCDVSNQQFTIWFNGSDWRLV